MDHFCLFFLWFALLSTSLDRIGFKGKKKVSFFNSVLLKACVGEPSNQDMGVELKPKGQLLQSRLYQVEVDEQPSKNNLVNITSHWMNKLEE